MDTSKPSRTMCAAVLRLLTDEGRRQRRDERTYSLHTPRPSARLWTSLLCCGHVAARTSTWHTGSPREMAAEAEVIAATKRLLGAVGSLDYATYEKLSSDDLTCVEPETQGHVVQGLAFHKCARE